MPDPLSLRRALCIAAAVATASCAPRTAPDTGAASGITPVTYRVSVPASRKIALVAPSAPTVSVRDIENAARRDTGCRATVIDRVSRAVNGDTSAVIPSKTYLGFGGQLPVTLTCT